MDPLIKTLIKSDSHELHRTKQSVQEFIDELIADRFKHDVSTTLDFPNRLSALYFYIGLNIRKTIAIKQMSMRRVRVHGKSITKLSILFRFTGANPLTKTKLHV